MWKSHLGYFKGIGSVLGAAFGIVMPAWAYVGGSCETSGGAWSNLVINLGDGGGGHGDTWRERETEAERQTEDR